HARQLAEDHLLGLNLHAARHWIDGHRAQISKCVLAVLALLYLLSAPPLVGPDELGVVRRFGQRRETPLGPGLHYRIPWPVEQVTRLKPQRIQIAELGFPTTNQKYEPPMAGEPSAYEWNLQHRSGRYERQPDEALMLT